MYPVGTGLKYHGFCVEKALMPSIKYETVPIHEFAEAGVTLLRQQEEAVVAASGGRKSSTEGRRSPFRGFVSVK